MQLLHPWLLLGLVLVPAAVLLHVLRVPGRRHEVSYLRLWRNVLQHLRPEATERLKRFDWLLILEVLIVVLLVVGLAQPVVWRERPRRHVGFIIDTSASMKTVDADGRSRWEKGLEAIGTICDGLGADDVVSYYAGPLWRDQAQGKGSESAQEILPGEFKARLEKLHPDNTAIAPAALLEVGLGALGAGPGGVYLVTDKAPPEAAAAAKRVRRLLVGGASRNCGIVAFSGSPGTDGAYEVFVRIRNYADAPAERQLVVTDASDTPRRFPVTLQPGGRLDKVFSARLTTTRAVLRIGLEGPDDGFAADDVVKAFLSPLAVVGAGEKLSPAYARLFGGAVFENTTYVHRPDANLETLPANVLFVTEGVIPRVLGAVTVVVNPPEGKVAGITVDGEKTLGAPASPLPEVVDPLMRSVNLAELKVDRCRPLTLPDDARPLMRVGGDVVAAAVEPPAGKVVVLSFDATQAAWQLKPSFVVFWANVLAEARRRTGAVGLVAAVLGEVESDNRPKSGDRSAPPEPPVPAGTGKAVPLGPWLCLVAGVLTVLWWHFRR